MWISRVEFKDNIYEFRSGIKPTLGNVAYWLWEKFIFEEDTCYYLDNMEIIDIVELKYNHPLP